MHPQLHAHPFTNAVPQQQEQENAPVATPIPEASSGQPVHIDAASIVRDHDVYTLSGDVVLRSTEYILKTERAVFHADTGVAELPVEFTLEGGPDHEHIRAARGEVNTRTGAAHFYDVTGTIVVTPKGVRPVFESGSPFLFHGKEAVKEGPAKYLIYKGTVTSCELPHPDWDFAVSRATLDGDSAKLYGSVFRLVQVPLFYLPYATHAVNSREGRQTGLLIPTIGTSSSKGTIIGDEFFWAINRSMDFTLGIDYFSQRGWAERGVFHYRGAGLDFARGSFSALQDRGLPLTPPVTTATACLNSDSGTTLVCNQGGEDLLASGRHDFSPYTRAAGDLEYLSSYIYREAFAESFALAVNSEVKSTAYLTHNFGDVVASGLVERYQNFEDTTPGNEIRILHVPSLEVNALDHMPGLGFFWNANASADGLRRSEPGFATGGVTERVEVNPAAGWDGYFHGLSLRPWVGVDEAFYSRSQEPGTFDPIIGYTIPIERAASINRSAFETGIDLKLPAVERTFAPRNGWRWRHVLEPDVQYRYVAGIDDFKHILRFDETDVLSDTNEAEYGLTQRLYMRHPRKKPCAKDDLKCSADHTEALSWRVAQKYFFDPRFGHALYYNQRNVLETTVMFSGAAFLTSPRYQSPVISRLKLQSSSNVDFEWDADYDPKLGQLLMSNLFAEFHAGDWQAGLGNAHLLEPGEQRQVGGTSAALDFNQIRLQAGYGSPTKIGFSAAANAGYDFNLNAVQYGAVQTGYNWNCCGLTVEYRRFALGSVRNENSYRFNLTLAGVGTAGNLRRSQALF